MSFFRNFGTVYFTLDNGETIILNDLTKFVTVAKAYSEDPRLSLTYEIKDGDRPELLANRLYGSVNYWWAVQLVNGIWDYENQWPRNDDQLDAYIAEKYPFQNPGDVLHYQTVDGLVVDLRAIQLKYNLATPEDAIARESLTAVSIYDYEHALNEQKRNIKLVDPDNIAQLENQLKEAFK